MCKDKKCKFCFCKAILVLLIIGLVAALFLVKDSSDYFLYKTSLNIKNQDFEKIMTSVNVDKIIENQLKSVVGDTKNSNNFLSSTVNMLLNSVKDKFSGQIKDAIYANIKDKGAKLKDSSRFQIIRFLISKKNNDFTLTKNEIDKNTVKYILKSKDGEEYFTLSKNEDDKWEIVDLSSNNLLDLSFLKF